MEHPLKVQKIVDFLLKEIKENRLRQGSKIPSEYLLADMFNVHKSTANRAVASLVERGILKRCLGGAGTIVMNKPESRISIVIPLSGISFTARILEGAQAVAFKNNFFMDYFQWPSGEDSDHFWKTVAASSTKGIIVYGGSPPIKMPFPVMHVCALPDDHSTNWVVTNDFLGGKIICENLISQGHREIVFVSLHFNCATIKKRADGFLSVLTANGYTMPENRIFSTNLSHDNLPAIIEQILKAFPSVTAIAFDQDPLAAKALKYLKKKGLCVPDDISIIGYGCVPECQVDNPISSVEQFPAHIGYTAAESLISLIENGQRSSPIQICLPVELTQSYSVKKLPFSTP